MLAVFALQVSTMQVMQYYSQQTRKTLKEFAFAIADLVYHIFNASFSSGFVPDIWKRANVIPIPKSNPL